jgi:hypothetical protein
MGRDVKKILKSVWKSLELFIAYDIISPHPQKLSGLGLQNQRHSAQ